MMPRYASLLAAIAMAGVLGCGPEGSLPRSEQTVGGVTVYLGIVPAALVQGHSTTPGDPQALHGGAQPGTGSHHVMVALFNAGTGARITDARVRASVDGRPSEKSLEPMEVNGLMTYGNFFALGGRGVRRIRVEILRAGKPAPIEADFAYEHQPGT
jgi:hypothetical protein